MSDETKCPKCGFVGQICESLWEAKREGFAMPHVINDKVCLRRQLAAANERNAELEAENEALNSAFHAIADVM